MRRINPDEIEVVSDHKLEDEMPNITEFLDLPPPPILMASGLQLPSSMLPDAPLSADLPTDLPSNRSPNNGQLNWADFLANSSLSLPAMIPACAIPSTGQLKPIMNWDMVGPAFHNADMEKNEHKLDPSGIPDALRMMIHLKLFIPLSMLTMVSLT